MSDRLVVMRLINMHKMHPQQDNSRVCALCSQPVGIYPSGQSVLRADPTIEIVCSICALREFNPDQDQAKPAAAPDVILQEIRDSFGVKKA